MHPKITRNRAILRHHRRKASRLLAAPPPLTRLRTAARAAATKVAQALRLPALQMPVHPRLARQALRRPTPQKIPKRRQQTPSRPPQQHLAASTSSKSGSTSATRGPGKPTPPSSTGGGSSKGGGVAIALVIILALALGLITWQGWQRLIVSSSAWTNWPSKRKTALPSKRSASLSHGSKRAKPNEAKRWRVP